MNEIFDWLDYNEDMRIAIMKDLIDRETVSYTHLTLPTNVAV